jgi:hypothetical protein
MNWFRSKRTLLAELEKVREGLRLADNTRVALELHVNDLRGVAERNRAVGESNMAVLLSLLGGSVVVSKDVIDAVYDSQSIRVVIEPHDNGSASLRLEYEGGDHAH